MHRILLAAIFAVSFAVPAFGQIKPTPASMFGWQEQRQIQQLQAQLAAQNAAQIAALQAQLQQQNHLLMQILLLRQGPAPTLQTPPAPIILYLPGGPIPKLDANPGVPKLDPNPGTPKLDPNPGAPKLDPNPGTPKLDPNPGTPKLDPAPGPAPKLNPVPKGPPAGYQTYTDAPPVIQATITNRDGMTRIVAPAVWRPAPK